MRERIVLLLPILRNVWTYHRIVLFTVCALFLIPLSLYVKNAELLESGEVKGVEDQKTITVKKEPTKTPTPTEFIVQSKFQASSPAPTIMRSPSISQSTPTPTQSIVSNQSPTATPTPQSSSISTGHLPVVGDQNAKVTIVEYSDFQCPYCKSFYENAFQNIKNEYINAGQVKFVYRHLPLSFHGNAQKAAEASECANEQGKFWSYHNTLFTKQGEWGGKSNTDVLQAFADYASSLGMDSSAFKSCVESGKHAGSVSSDSSSAASLGVSSTPTVFINSQKIVGALPFDEFKKVIEQELAK